MTQISIGISDSFLLESQSLLEKSIKISHLARAASIFRVGNIYIYKDSSTKLDSQDEKIIEIILEYLNTPPYLRKRLFQRMPILQHVGMLPPIKAPHHKAKVSLKDLKIGDVRVGAPIKINGSSYADVGLDKLVQLVKINSGLKKIMVKIMSIEPCITGVEVTKEYLQGYWGYTVVYTNSLKELLRAFKADEIILTSIQGRSISDKGFSAFLGHKIRNIKELLVVFGGPSSGLKGIMKSENVQISDFPFVINMFPNQGTETVRVEEAILGTLSILNKEIGGSNKLDTKNSLNRHSK
jgi:predicted SPOUT superfamily RNA methylase MTH1